MTSITTVHDTMPRVERAPVNEGLVFKKSEREKERREYRLTLNILIIVFLVLGLVSLILPRAWKLIPYSHDGSGSFFKNARRCANEITPFIFMR
jgi:hypothetical protein